MNKIKTVKKKQAMRTCIATGKKYPKNDLIRFVRTSDGTIKVDLTGKLEGRGANMAMEADNFDLAIKKKAFNRAFKLEKNLTTDDLATLKKDFLAAIEEKLFRKGKQKVTIKVSRSELENIANK
ncbi:MAG: YlxR family protein [Candidatus Dojkabacteria bacterium]|uniref:YlxR domain-containing protein n=2 Tax=Candidatus Dojkabacteria TaxID=74243 RepID=A0A136KKR5_9BACT|nr:MAG: hypothetical protein UZ20_WS6002000116 [candidate division WS6 bacterium OLB21]MBW7953569.1 YlxR family protein [Candidatus Dojkabacteria bacterium]WKZ27845.1 MAG: YlxR family protein [Candidatus Dojkabacteria bacterium]